MAGQRLPLAVGSLNGYGVYDFTNGECLLWQDGWCDGEQTVQSLRRTGVLVPARRLAVLIWTTPPVTRQSRHGGGGPVGHRNREVAGLQPGPQPERTAVGLDARGSNARLLPRQRLGVDRGLTGVHRPHQEDPLALIDRLWPKFDLDPEFEEKLRELNLIWV